MLAKAKARLTEAKLYHEAKAKDVNQNEQDPKKADERKAYHLYQAE
jgi:hypothetical protein